MVAKGGFRPAFLSFGLNDVLEIVMKPSSPGLAVVDHRRYEPCAQEPTNMRQQNDEELGVKEERTEKGGEKRKGGAGAKN